MKKINITSKIARLGALSAFNPIFCGYDQE